MEGAFREFSIEPEDVYRSFTCLPGTYEEEAVFGGPVESSFWKLIDAEFAPGAPNAKGAELTIPEPIGVANETAGPFQSSGILQHAAWIEPHSSFSAVAPPNEILNRVCTWLESSRIAFEPQVEKFKLKGRVVAGSVFCAFAFRAYKSAAAFSMKGNVFELQRRNGCALLFDELFQQLVTFLGPSVVQLSPFPLPIPPPSSVNSELGGFPPPLTLGGLGSPLTLQEDDATALLRMVDSPLQDVQLEGLRVLAAAATECTLTLKLVCDLVAARVGMAQWITKLDGLKRQEDNDLACSAETLLTSVQEVCAQF